MITNQANAEGEGRPQPCKVMSFCAYKYVKVGPAYNTLGSAASCFVPRSSRDVVLHSVHSLSYEISTETRHLKAP